MAGLRPTARVAAGLCLAVLASGCQAFEADEPVAEPTRKVEFTDCPTVRLAADPPGFRLARRQLEALRDNHMGEVATYRSEGRSVVVYSGPDLYDELEDLDTTAERVEAADLHFTLYSTLLAPELLIAVLDVERLDDPRFEEPCDSAGVLTRHVTRPEMLRLLRQLRVEPG